MNYLIEPYIYPIMDGNICVGQGFLADGYFITAAHIVKDNPNCYIKIGEHETPLCKYKYIYGRKSIDAYYVGKGDTYKEANHIDVILFKWGNNNSPLHLNIHKPQLGEVLKSYCVEPLFDSTTGKYYNKFSIEKALVLGEDEGNYFYCKCKRFEGSSGSPLLWENQVVGIMHGGKSKYLYCAFLKIESFVFSTDIEIQYDKSEIIKELLPYGIDRVTAICILYYINVDITILGIDMMEEKISEDSYHTVLKRLPFKIDELTEIERKVLDEYCTNIVLRTNC